MRRGAPHRCYLRYDSLSSSPSQAEVEANDSVAELVELQREGKVRFIGISGVLPNLTHHIAMGVFAAF